MRLNDPDLREWLERESFPGEKEWIPRNKLEDIYKASCIHSKPTIGQLAASISYNSGEDHGNHGPPNMNRTDYMLATVIKQETARRRTTQDIAAISGPNANEVGEPQKRKRGMSQSGYVAVTGNGSTASAIDTSASFDSSSSSLLTSNNQNTQYYHMSSPQTENKLTVQSSSTSSTGTNSVTPTEAMVKRGRGRPRKVAVPKEEADNSQNKVSGVPVDPLSSLLSPDKTPPKGAKKVSAGTLLGNASKSLTYPSAHKKSRMDRPKPRSYVTDAQAQYPQPGDLNSFFIPSKAGHHQSNGSSSSQIQYRTNQPQNPLPIEKQPEPHQPASYHHFNESSNSQAQNDWELSLYGQKFESEMRKILTMPQQSTGEIMGDSADSKFMLDMDAMGHDDWDSDMSWQVQQEERFK